MVVGVRAFAVSALGRDRPGIIAGVTEVLADFALGIEDGQASVLRGHFALTLVVSGGDHVEPGELERALVPVRERLGLEAATVCEVDAHDVATPPPPPSHVVEVACRDRPGVAHAVSAALEGVGATVVWLEGGAALRLAVALPPEAVGAVRDRLGAIGRAAEVDVRVDAVRARAA
jgi:glycine cleavage system transcriptional repressor